MQSLDDLPFVSVCTPTFNRRPFIPFLICCFEQQTYPKSKIEWIIIDDGTDPIGDLVSHIPQVKYFFYEQKMELGKKRNLMHSKCCGDYVVYMDDDDYYPPERISHGVKMLMDHSDYLIAGSSEMHIYFGSKKRIYQCGPYGKNHATAATFVFKRELLDTTSYDENNAIAEESFFLKKYSIPMLQLETRKTILVFSHKNNSFDKNYLIENAETTRTRPSPYSLDDFITDSVLDQFYVHDMNQILTHYDPGT